MKACGQIESPELARHLKLSERETAQRIYPLIAAGHIIQAGFVGQRQRVGKGIIQTAILRVASQLGGKIFAQASQVQTHAPASCCLARVVALGAPAVRGGAHPDQRYCLMRFSPGR